MKNIAIGLLALASAAHGASISANLTADNFFNAYLSTSDSVLGTFIGNGGAWELTYNLNATLTPGVTNYLHIVAEDFGPPGAFIGDFTLSDTTFQFVNGTQNLVTNPGTFGYSLTGFGGPYLTPPDLGANGTDPWGPHNEISSSAHWIWALGGGNGTCGGCIVYFSTPITPTDAPQTIPEPATMDILGAGLALIGIHRRASLLRK